MLKFYLSPKQTIYRYIVNIDTMVPYGSYGNCPPNSEVRKRAKAFRLTVGEAWPQVRPCGQCKVSGGKMGVSAFFFLTQRSPLKRGSLKLENCTILEVSNNRNVGNSERSPV